MNFKQFIKENPDYIESEDLGFIAPDAVVFGVKDNDVVFMDSPQPEAKNVKINNTKIAVSTIQEWFDDIRIYLQTSKELYERTNIFRFIIPTGSFNQVHRNLAVTHYLFQFVKDGVFQIEEFKKIDVKEFDKLLTRIKLRAYFSCNGRIWLDNLIVSFWETPTKENIDKAFRQFKKDVNQFNFEIPEGGEKWKMVKYNEITGEKPKVAVKQIDHMLSPIEKEKLKQQGVKQRVPAGIGAGKAIPGQRTGESPAQARARLYGEESDGV